MDHSVPIWIGLEDEINALVCIRSLAGGCTSVCSNSITLSEILEVFDRNAKNTVNNL